MHSTPSLFGELDAGSHSECEALMLHKANRGSDPESLETMPISTGVPVSSPILKFQPATKHKMIIRKHESIFEKVWRNRGVLLLTAVPMLVILATAYMFFPANTPSIEPKLPANWQPEEQDVQAAASGSSSSNGKFIFNIVLDAGSTGSRIHIFKFKQEGSKLNLLSDGFHQLKPGLSAFPDDPEKAAQSLKPLMDEAIKTVPKEQQAATGLTLKATAGLRLLPGSKADDILEAVRKYLAAYPFKMNEGAVEIMDGAHEGAFAWLTLNYLLGRLDKGPMGTVAAIDLGGGSVQEAFALPQAEASAAPQGYITQMKASGVAYNVYVHSYLGYGLMAARAKVIEAGGNDRSHPCFAKGSALKYAYAGKEYSIGEVVEAGDFKRCAAIALKALEHGKDCGQPKEACSFSGAWRGKPAQMARVYYVSSYFWDRALEGGIITDKAAIEWTTSPADFANRAASVCGKDVSEIKKSYSSLQDQQAPYFCLDLSFCHTVLTQGFDLAENAAITLVKQVKYNGQTIEAAWPLGAAINDLSS